MNLACYLNSFVQCLFTTSEFKNKIQAIDPNQKISILNLMTNLEGVPHVRIQEALLYIKERVLLFGWDHFETQMAMEDFLKEHYHHGDAELDLSVPRWGEVPHRVQEMVELLIKNPTNELKSKSEEKTVLDEINQLELEKKGSLTWKLWKKNSLIKEIYQLRNFLKEREEMRTLSTRAYYLLRLVV